VFFLTFVIVKKIGSLLKERKKNITEIQEKNRTIQKIFDVVPVGIIIIDSNKKIRRANKKAMELFQVNHPDEIVQKECRNWFDINSESSCPFDDAVPFNEVEVFLLQRDGRKIPILKNVMSVEINNENYLLEAFMDITDQKETEMQLKNAKLKAEESNKLKSAFLQNMSHEIRTPLNGILGFSQFLSNPDISKADIKRYSEIIISSGNHLLEILNDIIDIAKIESGQLNVHFEKLNINTMMNELLIFFQKYKIQKGKENIEIKYSVSLSGNDAIIQTDKTRIKQILNNLINNAIKFTDEGEVKFGYALNENNLVFFVRDTGIGISEKSKYLVFERFNQASDTTERLYGGTGLGLTISKACVEMLGGEIWLESDLGKGTIFFFSIPYIRDEE
jgi:PAS domain S-box-containing protein